ncbi:response regulator transcription factor [Youxingia wuxianensis]|uniref:Stage 0 sporulation protein A homolog n=1 Tax=Youxingia wuxianensis TaxID=2763678 RepID=A0A926ENH5_9FIRM|nr:response regulator [Youxingia wuxianensis]MBC8584901.1 response regulator [Youxingia wuxianensis]
MHKVILIDDDTIICRGISQTIDWQGNGFILCGVAKDAIQGLELVEEYRPDIVITDIKMPLISGIELCEILQQDYPNIKVILLSGHEEFHFAQKAIEHKAFSYLTKPIESENLLKVLKDAVAQVIKDAQVETLLKESIPLLRQNFLISLLTNRYDRSTLSEKMSLFSIPSGHYCAVTLFRICDYGEKEKYEREKAKMSALVYCGKVFSSQNNTSLVDYGENEIVAIHVTDNPDQMQVKNWLQERGEEIVHYFHDFLGLTCIAVIGNIYDMGIKHVFRSYEDILRVLNYDYTLQKGKVVFSSDFSYPSSTQNPTYKMKQLIDNVVKATLYHSCENAQSAAQKLRQYFGRYYLPLDQIRAELVHLAFSIIAQADDSDLPEYLTGHGENPEQMVSQLYNCSHIDDIFLRLRQFITAVSHYIQDKQTSYHQRMIMKAVQFIKCNYRDPSLSLKTTASFVGISHSYLSLLFKKEMGVKFFDYLLEIRMNTALDLIKTTDYKTYEISELVGYANPHYFSASFKKYFGVTISEVKRLDTEPSS